MKTPLIILLGGLFAGCGGSTGQRELSFAVAGAGEQPAPFAVNGWQVTLSKADVAFGPAYFCATAAASSDLCPTAVAQFAQSALINALDASAQPLGVGDGQTGTLRSATYDFGFSWFPTQRQPTASDRAPRGHSAVFEGQAEKAGRVVRFVAEVDIVPRVQGTRAVQGAPTVFELLADDSALDVVVRPREWWSAVDFDELALSADDPVVVKPGSRAYEALVFAMTAAFPPQFSWSNPR